MRTRHAYKTCACQETVCQETQNPKLTPPRDPKCVSRHANNAGLSVLYACLVKQFFAYLVCMSCMCLLACKILHVLVVCLVYKCLHVLYYIFLHVLCVCLVKIFCMSCDVYVCMSCMRVLFTCLVSTSYMYYSIFCMSF